MSDLDWVAGLFEGEGSIQISRHIFTSNGEKRTTYVLWVRLGMLDGECVRKVAEVLGGSARVLVYGSKAGFWRWDISSRMAGAALEKLLPAIRSERVRQKALLGLEFQGQKIRGRPYDPEYQGRQRDYYERMKVLNLRGAKRAAQLAA